MFPYLYSYIFLLGNIMKIFTTKFIIVVPSIAIKEGVQKTIDITRDHFRGLYSNVNYDAFVYDGKHIEKIRDFATSNEIQIMVITINAFQKDLDRGEYRDSGYFYGPAQPRTVFLGCKISY